MKAEQLQNIILMGEGYQAEFKKSVPSKKREIAEEVCAFANAAGRLVLIGVDDDNSIHRVSINNKKRFIVDDKPLYGPLFSQYKDALQWLKGKMNVRYDIEGQGTGPRKEIWEIPETVFKEAVINACSP